MNGLTEVNSSRSVQQYEDEVEVVAEKKTPPEVSAQDKMFSAVAENFDKILYIAENIVNIQAVRVKTKAQVELLEQERKNLLAEAEAYAIKKNQDTIHMVKKLEIFRDVMNAFINSPHPNMTVEEFRETLKFAMELAEGEK